MSDPSLSDLKLLPSVDRILHARELAPVITAFGRDSVVAEVRRRLETLRAEIAGGNRQVQRSLSDPNFEAAFCDAVAQAVRARCRSTMLPVYNLTGTVIHTNLGRAVLPESVIDAIRAVLVSPVNLEYDLETGTRGDRDSHVEQLLTELTGAEAATVVNNNAAAVVLVLTTLAVGREVLISRGEMVEIGDAFRIPEVMGSAGCRLKEVGATNRTRLQDYRSAIDEHTALLMKVHTSNYEIRGFTGAVTEKELASLAREKNLPLVVDLGSGSLVDLQQFGLPAEPVVADIVASGVDLVTFSGDKLLGGPQAGIIAGKKSFIDRIKRNPLKRALRTDKLTLAALQQILNLYRDPQRLGQTLPVLRDLTRDAGEIRAMAEQVLPAIQQALHGLAEVSVTTCRSQIGSGALPVDLLESYAIAIRPIAEQAGHDRLLQILALAFRRLPRPVIGRVHDGVLLFDIRCLWRSEAFVGQLDKLTLQVG